MAKQFNFKVIDQETRNTVEVRVVADDQAVADAFVTAAARKFFESINAVRLSAEDSFQ